jgi:hypothetical protein
MNCQIESLTNVDMGMPCGKTAVANAPTVALRFVLTAVRSVAEILSASCAMTTM